MRRRLFVIVAVAGAWLAGCSGAPTGLEVTIGYPADLGIERIRIRAEVDGTRFPAQVLPDEARPLHETEESVVLLFPDGLAGAEAVLLLEGLVDEAVVASLEHPATLVAGEIVAVTVTLAPTAECGNDGDCAEGQRCVDGTCRCDGTSCPDGCCADGDCVTPSALACGIGGGACSACGADADGCVEGDCVCGDTGAACEAGQVCVEGACVCTPGSCPDGCCDEEERCNSPDVLTCAIGGEPCAACDDTADRCTEAGVCACGDEEGACDPGQVCVEEACACTPASCPDGCCDAEGACRVMEAAACGVGGAACVACPGDETCTESGGCSGCAETCDGCCIGDSCIALGDVTAGACGAAGAGCRSCGDESDRCSTETGTCVCGETGAPCGSGQRCEDEACVCDGASCAEGCCADGLCETPDFATCGAGGGDCVACDPVRADRCDGTGSCACGDGAPCEAGQACDDGACICDRHSCPDGCCDGDTCLAGTSDTACGKARACADCTEEDALCEAQVCSGCAAQCLGGCCDGLACNESPDVTNCGWNGSACVSCGIRADECVSGECRCGGGPACDPGQICESSECRCNPTSCSGCCVGNTCVPPSEVGPEACGAGGGSCVECDSHIADNCSTSGNCRCGTGDPCGDGLQCVSGSCVCNTSSGCAGCCAGNECLPGDSGSACGSGGVPCQNCGLGLLCTAGVCD